MRRVARGAVVPQPAGTRLRSGTVWSCEVRDFPHLCGFFRMRA